MLFSLLWYQIGRVARFFDQYEPIAAENDETNGSGGDGTASSSPASSEHDHESDFR